MIGPRADRPNAVTLGGDKGYDAADFVMELREINVTPHIVRNAVPLSMAARHPGYAASLRSRKRIEEGFGWMKTVLASATRSTGGSTRSNGPSPLQRWPIT